VQTAPNTFPDEKDRPCFRVYDQWLEHGGEKKPPGVYYHTVRPLKDDAFELVNIWICDPLHILAKTRDATSSAWGRWLHWHDADKVPHSWTMPAALLEGDSAEFRRELAHQGLSIGAGRRVCELLENYIKTTPVKARVRCVERLGWHGGVYVTPNEVMGQSGDTVVFQNASGADPALSTAGTVEQWRDSVARLAAGNTHLIFALSVAFAAPLAELAGEDSGGFHLRGSSSSGKTTALRVAASVWGQPADYVRTWRATANGLEGIAALHNDGLLILDELSQIDGKEAGQCAYMLANGQGKNRATRTGGARQMARWRLLLLSAGEVSLAGLMAADGRKANAGQEIRLADVPADAGAGMGLFEQLHGHATPAALAQAVKGAAGLHYGAAGLAFLRDVVRDRAGLTAQLARGISQFIADAVPANAAGQVTRIAQRFGLVAAAGELGTRYGLTGWAEGSATSAARTCFAAWLEGFGGAGNREERQLFDQVRAFFEAHGSSRFENWNTDQEQRVINRAGFVRILDDGTRQYYVFSELFKAEVARGFDHKLAARVLLGAGWLDGGEGNRPTQKPRLPGIGPVRCYVFTGRVWGDEPADSFASCQKKMGTLGTLGTTNNGAGFSVPTGQKKLGTTGDKLDSQAVLSPVSPVVPDGWGHGKPSIGAVVPNVPSVPTKKVDGAGETAQTRPPTPAQSARPKRSEPAAQPQPSADTTGDLFAGVTLNGNNEMEVW
jgi:uncharacterized protein (DUF927 family)